MRSGAVRVFLWRGIETRLHWSLLVIASLLTWSLTGNAGGYSTAAQWVAAVLAAAAFAASIIGHKLGHSMSTRHVLDNVTVGDVMTPHPAMVPDTMTLATLVGCVLQKIQGSTVPVVRDGRLVGLITPDHLRRVAPGQWSFLTTADIAKAAELYATGLSTAEVGQRIGVNAKTISNHLKRAGYEVRRRRGWPQPQSAR